MKHKNDLRKMSEQFVQREWDNLAAFAWRKYLERGRGAVMATWACVQAFTEGNRSPYLLDYATAHPDAEPNDLLTRLTNKYDPEQQIVIMFVESESVFPLVREGTAPRALWIEGCQGIWIAGGATPPRVAQTRRAN